MQVCRFTKVLTGWLLSRAWSLGTDPWVRPYIGSWAWGSLKMNLLEFGPNEGDVIPAPRKKLQILLRSCVYQLLRDESTWVWSWRRRCHFCSEEEAACIYFSSWRKKKLFWFWWGPELPLDTFLASTHYRGFLMVQHALQIRMITEEDEESVSSEWLGRWVFSYQVWRSETKVGR